MTGREVTMQQIAAATGRDRSALGRRAAREGWPYSERPARDARSASIASPDCPSPFAPLSSPIYAHAREASSSRRPRPAARPARR